MKFAIFTKIDKDVSAVEKIVTDACSKKGFVLDKENPDVVFVLGGDGTFLRSIHHYLDKLDSIKFVGVNCGTLGFFYEFGESDVSHIVDIIDRHEYKEESHKLIECDLNDKTIYAANEIRFENPFHTLVCTVTVNGEELEKFHGNGLLVCNELGSTAYNKSLGGAVIAHDIDVLQLTEISTIQNNLFRSLGSSLITNPDSVFTFKGDFSKVVIGYDHLTCDCNGADFIKVRGSNKRVRIIHEQSYSYLSNIKRSFIK